MIYVTTTTTPELEVKPAEGSISDSVSPVVAYTYGGDYVTIYHYANGQIANTQIYKQSE